MEREYEKSNIENDTESAKVLSLEKKLKSRKREDGNSSVPEKEALSQHIEGEMKKELEKAMRGGDEGQKGKMRKILGGKKLTEFLDKRMANQAKEKVLGDDLAPLYEFKEMIETELQEIKAKKGEGSKDQEELERHLKRVMNDIKMVQKEYEAMLDEKNKIEKEESDIQEHQGQEEEKKGNDVINLEDRLYEKLEEREKDTVRKLEELGLTEEGIAAQYNAAKAVHDMQGIATTGNVLKNEIPKARKEFENRLIRIQEEKELLRQKYEEGKKKRSLENDDNG